MTKKSLTTSVLTILVSVLTVGGHARADYSCLDSTSQTSLFINEDVPSRIGNTRITLESAGKKTYLTGNSVAHDGGLFKTLKINLYPFWDDTLTVFTQPKSCGRGSCDHTSGVVITAQLKIGEVQTDFDCNETTF